MKIKELGFILLGYAVVAVLVALLMFLNHTTLVWWVGIPGLLITAIFISTYLTDNQTLEYIIRLLCLALFGGGLYLIGSWVDGNTTRVIVVDQEDDYHVKNFWQGGDYEFTSPTEGTKTVQLESGAVYVDNQMDNELYFVEHKYYSSKYTPMYGGGPRVKETCDGHTLVKVPVYPDYILELAPDKISIHFWEKSERNSLDWKY